MEISPVRMTQIARARDGRIMEVSGEAGAVVADIRAIDPTLNVNFNEAGEYFCVYQTLDQHRQPTVDGPIETTVLRVPMDEWDRRVVGYFEVRGHELRNGHDVAARLDREGDRRKAATEAAATDLIGDLAQRLFRPMQRALAGSNPRIVVPRSVRA